MSFASVCARWSDGSKPRTLPMRTSEIEPIGAMIASVAGFAALPMTCRRPTSAPDQHGHTHGLENPLREY